MTRIMTQELKWTEMFKKSTISMQLYTFSMKRRFRYVKKFSWLYDYVFLGFFFCVGVMYSGKYDACDVIL